jgi:ABC-2 type transport system ATP-binding protein
MSYAIRTVALSKKFRSTPVLDSVDLSVPEGSIFGLIGPNGAGKTTTIKVLMNIFQPSSGECEVLETATRQLGPRQFAEIGYVSENQEMPGWMTVDYWLNFLAPFYPNWDAALAVDLVRKFDLPRDRKLKHLSRGMRVKAALASSLAYRPRLIVLDEPFTGLDALVRDELIEGLLERADGTTIFISSHDLAEIESFASHVGYLDRGRIQFSEELDALSSRFREVALTFDSAVPEIPQSWPKTWLQPERIGSVLRFIDTQFDSERTAQETRRLFPGARDLAENGMPLRSIFVTLAKASRTGE